jgi:hypothetical protein
MAWSAPMTAVAGSTFPAASFNQYVRDNLNETAPAKATAAGQFFVSTAANAIAARSCGNATVATSETTTSTSYADLTSGTIGPTVTVTTGTSAWVAIKSAVDNNTINIGTFMSFAVSGASSVAASDANAVNIAGVAAATRSRVGAFFRITGLTAGSNTFQAKYKVASASTGTFTNRDLAVLPF